MRSVGVHPTAGNADYRQEVYRARWTISSLFLGIRVGRANTPRQRWQNDLLSTSGMGKLSLCRNAVDGEKSTALSIMGYGY